MAVATVSGCMGSKCWKSPCAARANGDAPSAWMTARRGTRSIRPSAFISMSAFPNALVLPRLEKAVQDDGFLSFQAERVQRVDQRQIVCRGHLFHRVHGVVEAAVDLQGVSAVCERLCQFSLRYLAVGDEDEDREVGAGAICGQRSGGVASGGADECTRSLMSGPAHGYSHAPVLEGARGVFSFVFGPEGRQAERGGV